MSMNNNNNKSLFLKRIALRALKNSYDVAVRFSALKESFLKIIIVHLYIQFLCTFKKKFLHILNRYSSN